MTNRCAGTALTNGDPGDDPSGETVVLLQDEIARLEAELRCRDEALLLADAAVPPPGTERDEAALVAKVEELTAELASRDETVNLLLEQTRLFEEAAAAQRAEWEHLVRWVEEVERRVEGRDENVDQLRDELRTERSRAESLRLEVESDRRGWETRRAGLEREVEHLRSLLASAPSGPTADAGAALVAVQEENRRLRAACAKLQRLAASAADAADLDRRVLAADAELEQARTALLRLDDERRRELNERDAEIASLRSRLARESLQGPPAPPADEPPKAAALDPDERIRAFRQHLRELHEREAEERAKQSFSARLSRLWRNTGPG